MVKKDTEIAHLKEENAKLKGKKSKGKGGGEGLMSPMRVGEIASGGVLAGVYDGRKDGKKGDCLLPALGLMGGGYFMKQKDVFAVGLGALAGFGYTKGVDWSPNIMGTPAGSTTGQ